METKAKIEWNMDTIDDGRRHGEDVQLWADMPRAVANEVLLTLASRNELVAHLRDYLLVLAHAWPEVLQGNDPVYNKAKALLIKLEGRI